ncbi:hypothetical protein Srubr_47040 [Streptomyces rubradiris]|uniref:Uncharacterized protein n=1 Tax=Streptomyces rubradiris TaxID=285531 RepID=A0ABQ3RG78_STRRR|nr:hypothetical protein GCM10018792_54170 [Streptomyces rubradiris]GHI54858.1 hypothetical protein Srubr_47040 [Streptomyces rubradiris]
MTDSSPSSQAPPQHVLTMGWTTDRVNGRKESVQKLVDAFVKVFNPHIKNAEADVSSDLHGSVRQRGRVTAARLAFRRGSPTHSGVPGAPPRRT